MIKHQNWFFRKKLQGEKNENLTFFSPISMVKLVSLHWNMTYMTCITFWP